MTEPNQVRPIMKTLNQVRELIIDAHNAGKAKGKAEGREEVVEFVIANRMVPLIHDWKHAGAEDEEHMENCRRCKWQAQLKEWGLPE